jgi:hypothetical protein
MCNAKSLVSRYLGATTGMFEIIGGRYYSDDITGKRIKLLV